MRVAGAPRRWAAALLLGGAGCLLLAGCSSDIQTPSPQGTAPNSAPPSRPGATLLEGDYPVERDLPTSAAAYVWDLQPPAGAEPQDGAPAGYVIYLADNGCEVRLFQGWLEAPEATDDLTATATMRERIQQIYAGQALSDFEDIEPVSVSASGGSTVVLRGMEAAYDAGAPWSSRVYYRGSAASNAALFFSVACASQTWSGGDAPVVQTLDAVTLAQG